MLDWHTIQAAAASTEAKLVVRFPNPHKANESKYFYHINKPTGDLENSKRITVGPARTNINRAPVSIHFKRFISKGTPAEFGSPALYNFLKNQRWGSFQPQEGQDKLIQYYPVPTDIHRNIKFPIDWKTPDTGYFDRNLISTHIYSVWVNKPAVQPSLAQLGFTFTPIFTPPEGFLPETTEPTPSSTSISPTRTHISETLQGIEETSNTEDPSITEPEITPGQRYWRAETRPTSLRFAPDTEDLASSTPVETYFFPPPPARMATRTSNFRDWLTRKNPDLESSHHPCFPTHSRRSDSGDTHRDEQWSRQRLLQLGKIDAHLNNLEASFIRNQDHLDDGRPHVGLIGTKIQSPYPSGVLSDELLSELNDIAYKAMVKMSKLIMKNQMRCIDELTKERARLLTDWTPTEDEIREARVITDARTAPKKTYRFTENATQRRTYIKKDSTYGPALFPAPLVTETGPPRSRQTTDHTDGNHARSRQPRLGDNSSHKDDPRLPSRSLSRPTRSNYPSQERRRPNREEEHTRHRHKSNGYGPFPKK